MIFMRNIQRFQKLGFVLMTSLFLSACSGITCDPETGEKNVDPYEAMNRKTYAFNQTVDKAVLKPVAKAYNATIPWPVRDGVSNFFDNLGEVTTLGNNILQLRLDEAVLTTWRFALNSTVGLLGLIDVGSKVGFPRHPQDLGLTFAKWGMEDSPYLVLPFFGSRTVRDTVGDVVDYHYLSVYPHIDPKKARYSLLALKAVSHRAALLHAGKVMNQIALDPYLFERDAYLQRRHQKILQNAQRASQDTTTHASYLVPIDETMG